MSTEEYNHTKVITNEETSRDSVTNNDNYFNESSKKLYKSFITLIEKANSIEELKMLKLLLEKHKENLTNAHYVNLKHMIRTTAYKCL